MATIVSDGQDKQNKALEKAESVLGDFAPEWKEAVENASDEEIVRKIAEVARLEEENQRLKMLDADIIDLKEKMSQATVNYREATAVHKAQLFYGHHVLSSRGK